MARIRTIKPSFWKHESLSSLPPETHMLAAALLNYSDDDGYFNANPKLIQAECCPLRDDSMNVQASLEKLKKINFIQVGSAKDGRCFGRVVNFLEHQRVNRPQPSKIKCLDISWGDSHTIHTQITEHSMTEWNKEGNGIRKGMERSSGASAPPGSLAWQAYSESYFKRYGTEPVRNAKVNAQFKHLVARLGVEAADVAGWYPFHTGQLYVRARHCVDLLLRDAEGLRTEWAMGRIVTDKEAKESDSRTGKGQMWAKLIEESHEPKNS